jgi:transcriptional regulator with XRE-family HTH domain
VADNEVGRRIRELRTGQGRSQAELVLPGVLSPSFLSLIESGGRRPSRAALQHLAAKLDTTVDYLATGKQPATDVEFERRLAFAELALHNGSGDEALAAFEAVLAEGAPASLRTRAELGRARALERQDSFMEAAKVYGEMLRAADPGTVEWAERATDLVRSYLSLGDSPYAISLGEQALEAFERLGMQWTESAVRLGVTVAGVHNLRGDLVRARLLLDRLTAIADEMGSPLAQGSAYWNASQLALFENRPADARLLAERAVALLGEADHARNLAEMRTMFGRALLFGEPSDPERALTVLLNARRHIVGVGSPGGISYCERHLAEAYLALGDHAAAIDWARSARDTAAGHDAVNEASAQLVLAEALHRDGKAEETAAALAVVEAALPALTKSRWTVEGWQRIARIHEERDDPAAALHAYREALAASGRIEVRAQANDRTVRA